MNLKFALWVAPCIAILLTSCLVGKQDSSSSDVFYHPQNYVGRTVRVCGYIHDAFEDQNIWISRNVIHEPRGPGLGFISGNASPGPSPWNNRNACVTGRLERSGCGADTICSASNFPYAVRVVPTKSNAGT
jgi:hypothetical protein